MSLTRRGLMVAAAASAAALPQRRARAAGPVLKFGVLTDLSGPYKDIGGPLATECARLAVADFGAEAKGMTVEVVQADHQNKPDVGAGIAREWFDRDGVDVILDVPNSGVSLAIAGVAKEKNKVFLPSNPGTSDLTG
ncbi:MAG: ABC transporter substrate-binding protein, partial [Rhodospirillales bacterium]|nr:ABC transporter substrate-binding protein [Rhodospirillales bacterium]